MKYKIGDRVRYRVRGIYYIGIIIRVQVNRVDPYSIDEDELVYDYFFESLESKKKFEKRVGYKVDSSYITKKIETKK